MNKNQVTDSSLADQMALSHSLEANLSFCPMRASPEYETTTNPHIISSLNLSGAEKAFKPSNSKVERDAVRAASYKSSSGCRLKFRARESGLAALLSSRRRVCKLMVPTDQIFAAQRHRANGDAPYRRLGRPPFLATMATPKTRHRGW